MSRPPLLALLVLAIALAGLMVPPPPQAAAEETRNLSAEFDRAVRRAERGDTAAALRLMRELAELEPGWAELFVNMGIVAEFREDWTTCLMAFRRYLHLDPSGDHADRARSSVRQCARGLPNPARLEVHYEGPPGAVLNLNGLDLFDLPLTEAIVLPPGEHAVVVRRIDHYPMESSVRLRGGETERIDARLRAHTLYGSLQISVTPAEVEVRVEGEAVGRGPSVGPLRRPVGRYLVSVQAEGFHPWQRYVQVERDETTTVEIRLLDARLDEWDLGLR